MRICPSLICTVSPGSAITRLMWMLAFLSSLVRNAMISPRFGELKRYQAESISTRSPRHESRLHRALLHHDTSAEKPGKCRRKKNRCDDFQIPYKHGTDLFLVEIFFYISGIHTHSVILRKTKPEKHNCSCSSGHPFNDLLFYQLFHFRCFTNTVS